MAKEKSLSGKLAAGPRGNPSAGPEAASGFVPSAAAVRETIESIVIAFVLAFLFRTFEAEAFVIPTGSMAPTLMGRHKDLTCPQCGCPYQVSASEEVDVNGSARGPQHQIASGTCPMCRFPVDLSDRRSYPSFSGDRILVGKFVYALSEPKRWDVVVFKFPGDATADARTNFIKRLVGLPGETLRIQHGDLWVRRGAAPPEIARKPPHKLLAMLQPVFDNDYMPRLAEMGWPERWRSESGSGAWRSDDRTTFRSDGTGDGPCWLRYRHLIPSYEQWIAAERRGSASPRGVTPQLITDFTAYDTGRSRGQGDGAPEADSLGRFWVGDLALSCTVELESDRGELIFELRKGGRQFQCRVDAATGRAVLGISGADMQDFQPAAAPRLRGPGRHDIRFSNCDNELLLWVDGRVARFDAPTGYAPLGNTTPEASDLEPVGVATRGAAARLSRLNIERDLYYIADMSHALPHRFSGPELSWGAMAHGQETMLQNEHEQPADFVLGEDQFFVLGDNSARSKDGRLWGTDNHYVPRGLLIGKALFIYWPHSWDKVPYVNVPFPYFPNFSRMGLVR